MQDHFLGLSAPELTQERLEALVQEIIEAGSTAAAITSKGDGQAKGLAVLLKDLPSPQLERLIDQFDLTLPLSQDSLETLAALKELAHQNRILKELSVKDTLTGLYNAGYFRDRLSVELERVNRTEKPCSLIMIDLDRFKPVNDLYGHQTGDEVLRHVAEIIISGVRAVDIPVRYGGDEFAIILPETNIRAADGIAERIRVFMETDSRTARYGVTGSFGLAARHHFDRDDMESLIERADQAMYKAKSLGGNRVRSSEADQAKEVTTEVSRTEKDALFSKLLKL